MTWAGLSTREDEDRARGAPFDAYGSEEGGDEGLVVGMCGDDEYAAEIRGERGGAATGLCIRGNNERQHEERKEEPSHILYTDEEIASLWSQPAEKIGMSEGL